MRVLIFLLLIVSAQLSAQSYKIALLKYNGGGDWYANPTSLPNLIAFCNKNINTKIHPTPATVEVGNKDIFNYPLLHMTGHGNVLFSEADVNNLRLYLESGGFLHIDDNYGMDEFIRREMKKVFPDHEFVELDFSHKIYHTAFEFATGVPKIHVHDYKAPQGFGIIYQGRLVCFYTFECDLGDGWEDGEVHNDSDETRLKALKMGANIVSYTFSQP